MKTTTHKVTPEYHVFLGQFSAKWVATRKISGDITHSVQRESRALAEHAIRAVDAPGGPHRVEKFA